MIRLGGVETRLDPKSDDETSVKFTIPFSMSILICIAVLNKNPSIVLILHYYNVVDKNIRS